MKFLFVVLLAVAAVAQEPERHDKYREDPKAYCLRGRPQADDKHAHECHCRQMCSGDQENAWVNPSTGEIEDQTCEMFCTLSHCVCHADEPCEPAK
jgi:hypothetical protein